MIRALSAVLAFAAASIAQVGPVPDRGTVETPDQKLRGYVTDAGKRIAGATVTVVFRRFPLSGGVSRLARETVSRTAQTGGDGSFAISVPAWRYLSVHARKGHRVSPIRDDIRMPAEIELELAAAQAITARLYDGKAPLKHAVRYRLGRILTSENGVPISIEGRTSATGELVARDLPPGPWQLTLAAGPYRLPRPAVLRATKAPTSVALTRGIDLDCSLLTGAGGKGIAGARIELVDPSCDYSTVTDATGRFKLIGCDRGPGATLLIEAEGRAKRQLALAPGLSPRDPVPQGTIMLAAGRRAFGRITGTDGGPLAKAKVVFLCYVHASGVNYGDVSVVVETDAQGRFETNELDPSGLYRVVLVLESGERQEIGTVDPRPGRYEPDLGTFTAGSRRIEATLALPDGRPTDLELRLYGPQQFAALDSWQRLVPSAGDAWLTASLLPGTYSLVAVSKTNGIARRKVEVRRAEPKTLTTTLTLRNARKIEGTVYEPSGKAAVGAEVQLMSEAENPEAGSNDWTAMFAAQLIEDLWPAKDWPRTVKTGKDGKFSITCFDMSGNYDLVARWGTENARENPPGGGTPNAVTRIKGVLARKGPLEIKLPAR